MRKVKEYLLVARAIYIKEMLLWIRYPSWIFTFIALPYTIAGLFYGVGYGIAGPGAAKNFAEKTGVENPFLYYLLGTVVFLMTSMIVNDVGMSIRNEQLNGTFEMQYLTPAGKLFLWSSYILPHATISLMVTAASTIPPLTLGLRGVDLFSAVIGVVALFLGLIPLFGIGFAIAALTVRFKEPWAVTNALQAAISLLSGFYYPLAVLPEWLRLAAQFIPTTHAVSLLRDALLLNKRLILGDYRLAVLVALSLVYPVLGASFYKRWEMHARRTGELSKY